VDWQPLHTDQPTAPYWKLTFRVQYNDEQAELEQVFISEPLLLFVRSGGNWILNPSVAADIRSFELNRVVSASVMVSGEASGSPPLLVNPRRSPGIAATRTGMFYCTGRCPVCEEVLELVTTNAPISFTLCCGSPKMLGDEVVSCPSRRCRVHQRPLCLDGRLGCRYSDLNSASVSFPIPLDTRMSEDLGMFSPTEAKTTNSTRALDLVQAAARITDEASLVIELRGCLLDNQADPRFEVLAPMPARVECSPVSGVLHRSTTRRAMARVRKLVDAAKASPETSTYTAVGAKRRRTSVLPDPTKSGPLNRTGGLKRPFTERSMKFYRHSRSEEYRVKVHRLSFGMNENTPAPDYDQLVRCMMGGLSEIP
jgi:hypothetical protein